MTPEQTRPSPPSSPGISRLDESHSGTLNFSAAHRLLTRRHELMPLNCGISAKRRLVSFAGSLVLLKPVLLLRRRLPKERGQPRRLGGHDKRRHPDPISCKGFRHREEDHRAHLD